MLSKYFSKALVEAGITLPEAEVRDLTFLADPKSCGWILKEDFLKVMVRVWSGFPPPWSHEQREVFFSCFCLSHTGIIIMAACIIIIAELLSKCAMTPFCLRLWFNPYFITSPL